MLAALRRRLPHARLLYAADSAYAPYGERDAEYVLRRSRTLTRFLLSQGARLIVVACNTATALAIAELRREWPELPFVGIEPAIKPALAARSTGDGPVGVLATPATLGSDKFRTLLQRHAGDAAVLLQPCPGLAEAIEIHGPQAPQTLRLLHELLLPLQRAGCTRIVLGCTHYPLLATAIRDAWGAIDVQLLDPADAVAAQAARVAQGLPGLREDLSGSLPQPRQGPRSELLQAWTNGDPTRLQRVATACGLDIGPVGALAEPAATPA